MNIEFRKAVKDDCRLVFNLSNDPLTRENSFNSEIIEWENHKKWFNKKLKSPETVIYIFTIETSPIGIVRFETETETIVGVTVAPGYRGKGYASLIIEIACNDFWKSCNHEIYAYIKESNITSIKAFEKAGFKLLKKVTYYDYPCLILNATKNE